MKKTKTYRFEEYWGMKDVEASAEVNADADGEGSAVGVFVGVVGEGPTICATEERCRELCELAASRLGYPSGRLVPAKIPAGMITALALITAVALEAVRESGESG